MNALPPARRALAAAVVLLLSCAALEAGTGGVDFDAGPRSAPVVARARQEAASTPSLTPRAGKGGSVWVSFARAEAPALAAAGLTAAAPLAQGAGAALFKVPANALPALSRFMHRTYHRCAGFFAYRSRAEALRALAPAARQAPVAYTLDEQAVVRPLLPKVREAQLRSTIETLAAYNNRFYRSGTGVQAAEWLAGRWRALAAGIPGASVELVHHDGWPQPSVVLTIPGTDLASELVVLGGHLDSINLDGGADARAPGADDNASGIAVLTEALRVLAASGFRPRRTLQFMGYAAEEEGLRGSQDIARRYADEGRKVAGVIQYDMTNFKGSPEDVFLLTDNVDPALTAFLGKLLDVYLGVRRSTLECGYACSDHASWTQSGYPAACAFESSMEQMNPNIHSDQDTLANSGGDAAHSVPFAKLAVAFAVELAKAAPPGRLASR